MHACREEVDMSENDTDVDFTVTAWREEGMWRVEPLPPRIGESFDTLVNACRAQPGEGGTLGMVSVAEEFFVLVRVIGEDVRILVSDVYVAEEWPVGLAALERLGTPIPDDDDDSDDPQPGGDLRIVEDFGMGVEEIELLLDDPDLYPDEQLAGIAARLGFGDPFDAIVESLD
jgi:putative tRNA adenosine deaminase-associated protein